MVNGIKKHMETKRGHFTMLRQRNLLYSHQALSPSHKGLQLSINCDRKGGVKARAWGKEGKHWFKADGKNGVRSDEPELVKQVIYRDPKTGQDTVYQFIQKEVQRKRQRTGRKRGSRNNPGAGRRRKQRFARRPQAHSR